MRLPGSLGQCRPCRCNQQLWKASRPTPRPLLPFAQPSMGGPDLPLTHRSPGHSRCPAQGSSLHCWSSPTLLCLERPPPPRSAQRASPCPVLPTGLPQTELWDRCLGKQSNSGRTHFTLEGSCKGWKGLLSSAGRGCCYGGGAIIRGRDCHQGEGLLSSAGRDCQ